MTRRPYYEDVPRRREPVDSIKWGYRFADLDELTRFTTDRCRFQRGSLRERYEIVWSGIAEALCTALQEPSRRDLVAAGMRALSDDVGQREHLRGRRSDCTGRTIHAYAGYWQDPRD